MMRRPFALLAATVSLAAMLAGCTGTPAATSTTSETPLPQLPEAGPATFYHMAGAKAVDLATLVGNNTAFPAAGGYHGIGTTTYEPTIGTTKSGALFITSLKRALTAVPPDEGTHIIRGLDEGRNWTDVGPFLGPTTVTRTVNSNDPFMAVDPFTNRIYDFDMCGTLSGFCISYSDDDGATWMTTSVATGESSALDHQSLAFAPAGEGLPTVGYPDVLAFCVNRGESGLGSWCSTSRDGGISWTPLLPGYPQGTPQCSGLSGHVKGAADGRFYRGNLACGGLAGIYRSDDGGVTWSEHDVPNSTVQGHDVEVALDQGGNLYAFWIGGKDGLPYLARSADRGDTWQGPFMVAAPGVTAAGFPAIAAGATGRIAFVYVGTTVEGGYKAGSQAQKNETWNGYLGVVTDAMGDTPLITTVAVNDPATDPLAKGPCGDTRCGGFGDFIDVTIDALGRPWGAFSNNVVKDPYVGGTGGPGIVGTLGDGPALRGNLTALPHLDLPGVASIH